MSQKSKVACLTEPEGHDDEVGGESEDRERRGGKESPVDRRAEGDIAELIDLEDGKGKCEEGGPDQRQ